MLSGDCHNHIHLWTPQDSGSWHVDQRPFSAHTASVEDLQWSPNERSVSIDDLNFMMVNSLSGGITSD